MCSTQKEGSGSCVVYFKCNPFNHLIVNLSRPIHPKLPSLIKHSLLCGDENVGGIRLPKICCPQDSIASPKEPETQDTTTKDTTLKTEISTQPPTTTYTPLNDEDRYSTLNLNSSGVNLNLIHLSQL